MTAIMVNVDIRDFSAEDWNRLAGGLSGFSLMQCWEWGEAKARTGAWRVERGTLGLDGHAVGAFQALVRRLPGGLPGGLAWINRAPLWRTDGGAAALSDMMEALRRHYAEERGLYLRLAPARDESEAEDGGLTLAGVEGWASAVLDLSRPVEDLRLGLRQKWRNALNKAERPGLEVRTGRDAGLFAEFLDGYRHMTRERGFATSVTPGLWRPCNRSCRRSGAWRPSSPPRAAQSPAPSSSCAMATPPNTWPGPSPRPVGRSTPGSCSCGGPSLRCGNKVSGVSTWAAWMRG